MLRKHRGRGVYRKISRKNYMAQIIDDRDDRGSVRQTAAVVGDEKIFSDIVFCELCKCIIDHVLFIVWHILLNSFFYYMLFTSYLTKPVSSTSRTNAL